MADSAAATFLDYRQADHESGRRGSLYVQALVAWMEHEQLQGNVAALAALREMKVEEARFALAKSEALGEVLKRMFEADAPEEPPQDDDFEDPALPPSERKRGDRP